ncbi:hypothetical protein QOT17_013499 [Balamuthia mandrillaris]
MEAGSDLPILYFFMMAFISELHGYDTDAMVREHMHTPVQGPALREQRAGCKVSKGLATRKGRVGEGWSRPC